MLHSWTLLHRMGFNCVVNSLRFVYFQVNCGLNIALERLGTRLVYNYDLLIAVGVKDFFQTKCILAHSITGHLSYIFMVFTLTSLYFHMYLHYSYIRVVISNFSPCVGLVQS